MRTCPQARQLFGPYWDDEISRGERDWLESHMAGCAGCRVGYERFSAALEAVASLPRPEMAADLAERALAEAKRRQRVPDVLRLPARPIWQPVAAVAGLALVAMTSVLLLRSPQSAPPLAAEAPIQQPRLVEVAPESGVAGPTSAPQAPGTEALSVAVMTDSLFDHADDVEFILDPITLRRGRAHTARLPEGIQGEQAVISF